MKQSFLRIILGTLILALGLAASLGFVARAYENQSSAAQRVLFSGTEEISLYSREGILLQTLTPGHGGQVTSSPVLPGDYYAVSRENRTAGDLPAVTGRQSLKQNTFPGIERNFFGA